MQETYQLKGIAILMMIWTHLFNSEAFVDNCIPLVYAWNGDALAHVIRKLCTLCVPLFTILGGYGLTATYQKNPKMRNDMRVLNLLLNFWFICFVYISLCRYSWPESTAFGLRLLLLNVLGLDYTWNGAWWFLVPYLIITGCSKPLIRFILNNQHKSNIPLIVIIALLFVIGYMPVDYSNIAPPLAIVCRILVNIMQLGIYFMLGILVRKHELIERFNSKINSGWCLTLLMALIALRLLLGASGIINPPFVLLFVLLFCGTKRVMPIQSILCYLGKISTNIWLFHYFFFTGIFFDIIFGLKYPILIFMATLILSVISSAILTKMYSPVRRMIKSSLKND